MESNELSAKIDELILDLKKSLLNTPYNSRNFFDKVKNWWQNVTKGAENKENPYYFQNKFGSLGKISNNDEALLNKDREVEQSVVVKDKEGGEEDEFKLGVSKNESRLTLKEYYLLNNNVKELDLNISCILINENYSNNLKNLEMFKIIDSWGAKFKKEIFEMLGLNNKASTQTQIQTIQKPVSAPPEKKDSEINFINWIRNESNMEYFINLVNRIYDSPQYSRKIPVIAGNLRSKNIVQRGKTKLETAVRNKIISILSREIKQGREENSLFNKQVWEQYGETAKSGPTKKDEEQADAESRETVVAQTDNPSVSVDDLDF